MKSGNISHTFIQWDYLQENKIETSPGELIDAFYLTSSGMVRKYVDNTKLVYLSDL